MQTYTLDEAAEFLKIHPDTARKRAKKGIIPASKVGRSWVFLSEDLANYVRKLYCVVAIEETQGLRMNKEALCQSTNVEKFIGSRLLPQPGKRYANLLGLTKKSKHKNTTTS